MKLHPIVQQLITTDYSGDRGTFIPVEWFEADALKYDNGKTNLNAILLLADLMYWYRPTTIRDEATGNILEYRNKFAGERLQKGYAVWGKRFGLTKDQTQDACYFLKKKGLINIFVEKVKTNSGAVLSNVTFFEPILNAVLNLKAGVRDTYHFEKGEVSLSKGTPLAFESETYTDTNTKTTTNTSNPLKSPTQGAERRGEGEGCFDSDNQGRCSGTPDSPQEASEGPLGRGDGVDVGNGENAASSSSQHNSKEGRACEAPQITKEILPRDFTRPSEHTCNTPPPSKAVVTTIFARLLNGESSSLIGWVVNDFMNSGRSLDDLERFEKGWNEAGEQTLNYKRDFETAWIRYVEEFKKAEADLEAKKAFGAENVRRLGRHYKSSGIEPPKCHCGKVARPLGHFILPGVVLLRCHSHNPETGASALCGFSKNLKLEGSGDSTTLTELPNRS